MAGIRISHLLQKKYRAVAKLTMPQTENKSLRRLLIMAVCLCTLSPKAFATDIGLDGWTSADALPKDGWRTFAKPLPLAGKALLLFQRDGNQAMLWHKDWKSGRLQSRPLEKLKLKDEIRFTALASAKGIWIIGDTLLLLRPDGKQIQMASKLNEPVAVVLADGNIMLLGNLGGSKDAHIQIARLEENSVVIEDHGVLAYGGEADKSGETYRQPGFGMTATLLDNGKVMIAGGSNTPKRAELYDPLSRQHIALPDMPHERSRGISLRLPDGRVLMAGAGDRCYGADAHTVDVYDPRQNSWSALPALPFPLCSDAYGADTPAATLSANGAIALGATLETEVMMLEPDAASSSSYAAFWKLRGNIPVPHISGVLQALANGDIAIAGGVHKSDQGCCRATSGVDVISGNNDAALPPYGLALAGAGLARRGELLATAGGRRFYSTSTGQMRYSSLAEISRLSTSRVQQIASLPFADGGVQLQWLEDGRLLAKGQLASNDRGFTLEQNHSSYMPDGNGGIAIYTPEKNTWSTVEVPAGIAQTRLVGIRKNRALFISPSAGLQLLDIHSLTWKKTGIDLQPKSSAIMRWLDDGRVIVSGAAAPCTMNEETGECEAGADSSAYVIIEPAADATLETDARLHLSTEPGVVATTAAIAVDGSVTQLGWSNWSPAYRDDTNTPSRPVIERSDAQGKTWTQLPVPYAFFLETGEASPCSASTPGNCRLLALDDPRTPGDSLLFMVQGNADSDDTEVKPDMVLWWFDDATSRWQRMLSIKDRETRNGFLVLPAPLSGEGRTMKSAGWHLETPALWLETVK